MPKNDLVRRIDQRIGVVNNIVVPGAASWTGYTFDDAHLLRRDGARSLLAAANWLWEPGAQVGGLLQARAYGADLLARLVSNYENRYAALSVLDATYANWLFAGAADAAGTDAVFSVDNTGTVKMLRGYVGDPTALHLYADPTLLEFRNGETVLSGFDPLGRTIYGFERMGPPHGPCVEMAEFTDETGETRYKWQILGENGVPGISFVTGNTTDPDDYRVIFGPEGAEYYMKFLSGVLTLAASVILLGGSIDKPLTLGLEGGIYQGSGTFAAPTTGLKIWNDGGQGRFAGFNAGVEQIGVDTDGKLKWAAGKGVGEGTGLSYTHNANTYWKLLTSGEAFMDMKLRGEGLPFTTYGIRCDVDEFIETAILGQTTDTVGVMGKATAAGGIGVKAMAVAPATRALQIIGGLVDGGSQRYTALANATADTDALNRQTGDARYMPLAGSQAGIVVNETGGDNDSRMEGDTEDKLFLLDAGLDVIRHGDGDTNYSQWDKTGHLTLVGGARPWRDELGQLLGMKRKGSRIAEDLDEGALLFADTCQIADDWVITNVQLNHDKDLTASIYPHLHWMQASANVPNWLLQYRWQINGAAKTTAWTPVKHTGHAFTYDGDPATINQITYWAAISAPGGASLSDIVQFRIMRDTDNDSTLFGTPGTDPLSGNAVATMFDVHFQINSLGSDDEYTK